MMIWFWVTTFIVRILLLIPGLRRVRSEREVGPEEGIEDEETIRSYEKVNSLPPFKLLRMLVIRRLNKLGPGETAADIGCGPGYFTREIARAFPGLRIIATDIADEMLARAERNLSSPDIRDRISYQRGDIHALPFEDDSLDTVVSTLSLHHWADPAQAFREIYRVLKPGGKFLVFDTRRDSPRMFYHLLKFAQKFVLPSQLREKNEPTSSIKASYTPEEAREFVTDLPVSGFSSTGGIFWMFVSGTKS